jgi:NAD(P)-dependent dehydrogenase (short-subunit alcohol dehydrogenase family)
MNLNNKVIIVTGGTGLIGKEIVSSIKKCNGIAINTDINLETKLDNDEVYCNITDEFSISQVINLVVSKYGRIDGLVNNAYPRTKDWGLKFEEIKPESWRENIDIQLNSSFVFCQKVLTQMKLQNSGAIVNVASQYGVIAPDFSVYDGTDLTSPAAYSAIKGGLINFTRYIASYFGKFGIRANCISPGGVFDNQNPIFVKNYESKVPMRRMGVAKDMGDPVAFLLSDSASYITGQNLIIDGGWTSI